MWKFCTGEINSVHVVNRELKIFLDIKYGSKKYKSKKKNTHTLARFVTKSSIDAAVIAMHLLTAFLF